MTAPRWASAALLVLATVLVPWTIWLSLTLPQRRVVHNWDAAWVGFDVGLVVMLAATGYALLTGHRIGKLLTPVIATLLVCDAWFDVLTASTADRWLSLALAFLVELPLAGFCLWLAHAVHVRDA
ncbi:MAG: hypothetical protein ACYDA3_09995 [Gaiellaceae bacterium]